jgi:IS4 transposase
MNKNTFFTGQPIFSQIINLIPRNKVNQLSKQFQSDKYYKKFKTYDHLISMLYCIFNDCTSIREVVTGLLACESKLFHLGVNYSVRRSTLSEANSKRTDSVFEAIYKVLYSQYGIHLPDSQKEKWLSKLYIFDSTTISLFQEILKNAGRSPMNGKRKGGIKAHTLIRSEEDVPCLVEFTSAAAHDAPFMKAVNLPNGSIAVFDKAYVDYNVFAQWEKQSVTFVTRIRKSAVYEVVGDFEVSEAQKTKGVISDKGIILGHNHHDKITKVEVRLVEYYDKSKNRVFQFLTNNFTFAPGTIAEIYKRRWQIESLFKRIKQNYPLKYFLGESENAIRIQIWAALIADILLKFIRKSVKRKWAFSNLASMIRLHLMNYIHLGKFLANPEKAILKTKKEKQNLSLWLFPT